MKGSQRRFLMGNLRLMGKPRARWEDITWRDTSQILGGWKRQAEDREVKRHLLRKSRAQKRL